MLLSVSACSVDSGYVLLPFGIFDGVEFADSLKVWLIMIGLIRLLWVTNLASL